MDIRTLSQLTGGAAAPAAAAPVPVDTRALISEIAASTGLTDAERGGLIATVANIDQNLTGGTRSQLLAQVQNLGIYLRNTGNEGFPRWSMMTALRSYGLNLSPTASAAQEPVAAAVAVRAQLEQISQQSRGVSVDTAVAVVAQQVQPAPVKRVEAPHTEAADTSTRVEKIV